MKTIKQWADEMPEEIRVRFLANCKLPRQRKFEQLHDLIMSAFEWANSNEKADYWANISFNAKHNLPLDHNLPEPDEN